MQRPLGAQMSHMLKSRGVEVIFGIPGVHNQELYRGIEEAGITHVLARHEQGAGFMADGYARATGRPGVAYVITGPGLCNIMNPMGQAYSDSVPLLVISSCLNRADLAMGRGRLHEMKDQRAAAGTVSDWSHLALDAASAYELIDRAFIEFEATRPRTKHIQVPIEVLEAQAEPPRPRARFPFQPNLQSDAAKSIAERLLRAERPLFIFGAGARGAAQFGEATQLVEAAQAAVFTTDAGRGVVAPDLPLSFGATLSRPESADLVAEADLVIAIGTELSETDLWRDKLGQAGTLVRVDIDPLVLADHQKADVAILADAQGFVADLAQELKPRKTPTLWDPVRVAQLKARWRAQSDAERPGIAALVDVLREATPPETVFYSDMTQFAYVANEVVELTRPGLWHHPSGFGTLGYALPAAIGGKIGSPEHPVISINGDSGFQYNIQELATAVELQLSLPIIVWDNGKLKEIEDSMRSAQIAPNAVIARNPDFCALAEAYGAHSAAPRSRAAFADALRAALQADGPTLIHITPETGAA